MKEEPLILHIDLKNQSVSSWLKENKYIIFSEIVRYSSKIIIENIDVIQAIIVSNSYDNIVFIIKKENVKNSLEKAMNYFLEIEEYEKCSEIRDLLNKL
jgi:protein-arginine kinase activator protein McsA